MKIQPKTDKYIVYVDDNFHYMDESERYRAGSYDTAEKAVAKCKKIVREFLDDAKQTTASAAELYGSYTMFGEDPFIIGPTETGFSSWEYAKNLCSELYPDDQSLAKKERK